MQEVDKINQENIDMGVSDDEGAEENVRPRATVYVEATKKLSKQRIDISFLSDANLKVIKNQFGCDFFNLNPKTDENEESKDPIEKIDLMVKDKPNYIWIENNPSIDEKDEMRLICEIGDIYIEDQTNGYLIEVKDLQANYESVEELLNKFGNDPGFPLKLMSYRDRLNEIYKNDID